jgi:hypothetical protein
VRRNEGFFIFCAGFRAGACIDADARIQCAAVKLAVRKAPIQLFRRFWWRGMALALALRRLRRSNVTD